MTSIAKEYGAALFMLACEREEKKEIDSALKLVEASLRDHPEYAEHLSSPAVSLKERDASLASVYESRIPASLLSFLRLLLEKGRFSLFFDAAVEYRALLFASERVSHARVLSAVELTEEEKERLVKALERKTQGTVIPRYDLDPSLLGGVVVEIDGKIMDGTLRQNLCRVKEVISV